jgi:hypothetical protein
LLEKLEFSKGTEWLRSEGLRISFINHYDVKIADENVLGDNTRNIFNFLNPHANGADGGKISGKI